MRRRSNVGFVLLGFFLRDATCLASSSSSDPNHSNNHRLSIPTRVVSVKKNGGEAKIFDLTPKDTTGTGEILAGRSPVPSSRHVRLSTLRQKAVSALRSTFLPSGYPSRTPPGYLKYCMCSWVQDLSTQLRSVLATQRVLEGVGVGREGATALSALMNYLVRDGCGMAATLLFTSASSVRFRTDVKRWRLFADLILDLGITLEVMAVLVPRPLFLPMISVGNMCKAICGVAAGACGGSINLHWAKGSDISDINAKFGAQHTVTGALGLIFAAFFARSVDHVNSTILWTLYATLTLVHIVANAMCMRLIAFDACNTARMNILLQEFFGRWDANGGIEVAEIPVLSSPKDVAMKEPLFFLPSKASKTPCGLPVRLGVSFDDFWEATGTSRDNLENMQDSETIRDHYLVGATNNPLLPSQLVLLALVSNISGREEAKAYFHANWLGRSFSESNDLGSNGADDGFSKAWQCFEASMGKSGWDLDKTELATAGYEIEFVT